MAKCSWLIVLRSYGSVPRTSANVRCVAWVKRTRSPVREPRRNLFIFSQMRRNSVRFRTYTGTYSLSQTHR